MILYTKLKQLRNKPQTVSIFLLCLTGALIPLLTWFKDGYIIAGVDWVPPFTTSQNLYDTLFIWNTRRGGLGLLDPAAINPFLIFWAFFNYIGMSIRTVEILWIIFTLVLPGLAMYYFASFLFRGCTSEIPRFVASFFYMINPFNVSSSLFSISTSMILTLMPLLLGILGRGFEKKESKYAFIFAISTFLFSSAAVHPPRYIILWFVIFAFALYYVFWVEKENRKACLFIFIKAVCLAFAINSWWMLSFFYSKGEVAVQTSFARLSVSSDSSSFLSIFRLIGGWWSWDKSFQGSLYYPYSVLYSTPLMILVTYLIPILAFSAPVLRQKRMVLTCGILTLVAIFLSKGLHSPLESVNLFLYQTIPFFVIFRDPLIYFNTVITFCYAILLGITSEELYVYFTRRKGRFNSIARRAVVVLMLLTIASSSWAVIGGDVIISDRGKLPGYQVIIPGYWLEAGQWIDAQGGDFKILTLPQTVGNIVHYDWGYYAPDLPMNVMATPVLGAQTGYIQQPYGGELIDFATNRAIYWNSTKDFARALALLNVKYVVQRNDLDWTNFGTFEYANSPQQIKSFLNSQENIHLKKTFGKVDIYELDENMFLPRIYAASSIVPCINVSITNPLGAINYSIRTRSIPPSNGDWAYVKDPAQMFAEGNVTYLALHSDQVSDPDNYIRNMDSLNINPATYPYLLFRFKTNAHTSVRLDLTTVSGKYVALYAENPTPRYDGLNYQSEEWYTLVFNLVNIYDPIDILAIHPTNNLDPQYTGKLELWIDSLKFAKAVHTQDTLPYLLGQNSVGVAYVLPEDAIKIPSFMNTTTRAGTTLTFHQVNPTQYKVHVKTSSPFLLVFSEPYDSGWKAYLSDTYWLETLWKKPIDEERHFLVNSYANAWYLEKTGEYDVIIYFLPQNVYAGGLIITSLTFIGCIVCVLFLSLRKTHREKKHS